MPRKPGKGKRTKSAPAIPAAASAASLPALTVTTAGPSAAVPLPVHLSAPASPRPRKVSLTTKNPYHAAPGPSKEFHSDAVNIQMQSAAALEEMVAADISRVLIIYTGGTIGMKNTLEHGYVPAPHFLTTFLGSMARFHDPEGVFSAAGTPLPVSLLNQLHNRIVRTPEGKPEKVDALVTPPSLWGKRIVYSVLEYDPLLDSSNMTMKDWVKIATDVELNYEFYDAFIILHGTDTMAYTASALSFMLENLGKTVILTGSQVPLSEVRNDAIENLLGALTIAGHYVIPVPWQPHVQGRRPWGLSAFDSPNLGPLVNVGIHIDVHWRDVWRPRALAKFRAHKHMDASVATLRIFPGITESTIRAFLQAPIRGVVLETYGAGNAPDARKDLLGALKEASDRGVVIVNTTQCKRGLVSDIYSTGKALLAAGVVPGSDLTPECALAKLSYLLGKDLDPAAIRAAIRVSLRGELTEPEANPRFALSRRDFSSIMRHVLVAQPNHAHHHHRHHRHHAHARSHLATPPTTFAESDPTLTSVYGREMAKDAATHGIDGEILDDESDTESGVETDVEAEAALIAASTSTGRESCASPQGDSDPAGLAAAQAAQLDARVERVLAPILLSLAGAQGRAAHIAYLLNEAVDSSVQQGATTAVNAVDALTGATALHHAAGAARIRTVRELLQRGAGVHARDRRGHTPLWYAATGGTTAGLGATPAAIARREAVVRLLVQTGAHLAKEELARATMDAAWAVARDDAVAVRMFLLAGVDVNAAGPDRRTLVHVAAAHLGEDMVAYLVAQHGCIRNPVDRYGRTPADDVRARIAGRSDLKPEKRARAVRILAMLEGTSVVDVDVTQRNRISAATATPEPYESDDE
ncbi:L-asparaginase, type I [Allomyces macrogynus ATCC 38327]|uniref:asparaginase n=1 Tax=Allomyces macrogynus (strain ATCC 38327) TaxID=578462 RepID=A0A0L0SGW5_ALLM3|nr:L-asparaginase, type I [Allomyces macrogynus ATCC 38327]|eukprot:KNE61692.1 L-asparaginase, type I [Allomyces macrogynus ATCC 38327]